MKHAMCGLMLAALTACGINYAIHSDVDYVYEQTRINYNRERGIAETEGPIVNEYSVFWRLRSFRPTSTGNDIAELLESFQLYVQFTGSNWYFLDSAYSDGKRLDVIPIDRIVNDNATVTEHLAINLSLDQMENYADSSIGMTVEVAGQRGSVRIWVPAGYFRGFLQAQGRYSGL